MDKPVRIKAQPKASPELRKLARALLMLAAEQAPAVPGPPPRKKAS